MPSTSLLREARQWKDEICPSHLGIESALHWVAHRRCARHADVPAL